MSADAARADDVTPPYPMPSRAGMLASLSALFEPADVIELRAFHPAREGGKKFVSSGYFDADHRQALVDEAERLNVVGAQVCVTLNQIDQALLSRSPNCVRSPAYKNTQDTEITRRRWLFVDLDPHRPAGASSTDEQDMAAALKAKHVRRSMMERGWPAPLVAESGNGCHLMWAIDLQNNEESKALVAAVLAGLAALFGDDAVEVDLKVGNAARLCKLWGTVARKGAHTAETPHRLSRLVHAPPRAVVTPEQLKAVAAPTKTRAQPPTRATPAAGMSNPPGDFDVPAFLARHGMAYSRGAHEGRDMFRLAHCPFNPDHTDGEAAVFAGAGGPVTFSCFHNSCADRQWRDVRDALEGPRPIRGADVGPQIDIAACEAAGRLRNGAGGPVAGVAAAGGVNAAVPINGAPGEEEDDGLSSLSHAPVFDYDMCPGILGRFIKSETEFSEAPPIGVLANIVTRLSADIGRSCFIQAEHKRMHMRINWLCAGPTALGRKGTAAGIAAAVRNEAFARQGQASAEPSPVTSHTLPAEAEWMLAARTETSLATGEGLIAMLRTSTRKEDAADFKPPGLIDNRLLVDAQEFAGVLKKASGKEATLSPRLREAWDGDTLSNTSAANAMQAERPHVVVNASVPDSELIRLLAGDGAVEASNGLLNRFIITYQRRDKIVADRAAGARWVFEQMADAYLVAVATAWGHASRYSVTDESSVEITMSEAARAGYRAWYLATQGRPAAAYVQAFLAREADYLQRYAALLTLLRGSLCIEAADIEAAKLLLDYWRGSLEFIFSQGQQTAAEELMHEDSKKLLNKMPIGRKTTMHDLRHTPKARRMPLLNWMQRQSPPWVALTRATTPGGGPVKTEVMRLL